MAEQQILQDKSRGRNLATKKSNSYGKSRIETPDKLRIKFIERDNNIFFHLLVSMPIPNALRLSKYLNYCISKLDWFEYPLIQCYKIIKQ